MEPFPDAPFTILKDLIINEETYNSGRLTNRNVWNKAEGEGGAGGGVECEDSVEMGLTLY